MRYLIIPYHITVLLFVHNGQGAEPEIYWGSAGPLYLSSTQRACSLAINFTMSKLFLNRWRMCITGSYFSWYISRNYFLSNTERSAKRQILVAPYRFCNWLYLAARSTTYWKCAVVFTICICLWKKFSAFDRFRRYRH